MILVPNNYLFLSAYLQLRFSLIAGSVQLVCRFDAACLQLRCLSISSTFVIWRGIAGGWGVGRVRRWLLSGGAMLSGLQATEGGCA